MTAKKTTKKKEKTIWQVLSIINVNEWTEKKGRFSYLSWAHAWRILMENFPEATFHNHLNQDGYPIFQDKNGYAMVRVTVTIGSQSHTEDFMVTDNYNKAIKNPDSHAINTALKRCLVKSMAYFGLGHYIYAGEDTPTFCRDEALLEIAAFMEKGENVEEWKKNVFSHYGINDFESLSDKDLEFVVNRLTKNKEKK